jgi:glyoxylase-like metal-dependent hydrolase (beta-lactamase superfamily II)
MSTAYRIRSGYAAAATVAALGLASTMGPQPLAQQPVGLVPLTRPTAPLVVEGLEVLPVQGHVHMVVGAGGNVTLQVGEEGVLVVDSGGPGQSTKLLSAITRLTPQPVRFVVNTSADSDHVSGNSDIVKAHGGNPQGQNAGVFVVAHENAYNRMIHPRPGVPALSGDGLPESTFFTPRKDFFSNGEAVQLISQPNAHTDGDVIVFFRESDVVSTGDVFVTTSYPVIDTANGGTVQGVIDSLNAILDLTVPERNQMGGTRVIPGHGRICNEADVVDYRDMVTIIRDRVRDMAKKGMTQAQIKAARPSLEYDGLYGAAAGTMSGAWTTDMFLDAVYRGVSGRK